VIYQNYFRRISFLNQTILPIILLSQKFKIFLKTIFVVTAAETLAGNETGWGGEWGLEVQLNLMSPRVLKVNLFPYFGPSGRLLVEGMIAFQIQFFVLYEKKQSDDISARRVLQTK
jgi:hypothetical protein